MGKRFFYGFSMFFALIGILYLDHLSGYVYRPSGETLGFFAVCIGMVGWGVVELDRLLKGRGIPFDRNLLILTTLVVLGYIQFLGDAPTFGVLERLSRWQKAHHFIETPQAWRELTLLLPLPLTFFYCMFGLRFRDVPNISARILANLGAFLYLVFPIAIILWIRRVPVAGEWLLYFLLASSRLGDVGAYLMGKAFGRHKLIPYLSAGKTKEGAFFGLCFSALGGGGVVWWAHEVGTALKPLFPEWWYGCVLGFFIGIAAQAGDLVESAFKRAADIKDSGQLVPSFGGVLDIMDNFMLTGPLLLTILALWP